MTAEAQRKKVVAEFLRTTIEDVELMRAQLPLLKSGDGASSRRLRNFAHNIAASSSALKLGVLHACARALEDLAEEAAENAPVDDFFLQCATSAVDAILLEVELLRADIEPKV